MPDKHAEYQEAEIIPASARFGGRRPPGPPLHPPGSGGPFNGMEARVAKLEAAVEHIQRDTTDIRSDLRILRDHARTDFRILFGAIITVALGLAGLMAKGFHWL